MTPPDAPDAGQEALQWVLAGYEAHPWTRMLDAQPARLLRVGVWWRENQACVPVSVEVVSERVVMVNDLTLVLTDYGGVTMILSPETRLTPPPASAPCVNGNP